MRVYIDLVGDLVTEFVVEVGRLETEGLKVEADAATFARAGLESADERGANALGTVFRMNPKLLQLAALAPAATHDAPDDMSLSISRKAGEGFDFVQRCRCIVCRSKTGIDNAGVVPRDGIVNTERELHRGPHCHVTA